MKTTYRDFEIEYDTLVGQFMYKHKDLDGPEDKRYGMDSTLKDVKAEIDEYYRSNIVYSVQRDKYKTVGEFSLLDAIEFCKWVGVNIGAITPRLHGFQFEFDAP